jgi:hypothetical protein
VSGTFLVVDSTGLARARRRPRLRLLTKPANRPRWPNPNAHSAVKLPRRPFVLMTDEVYAPCPWGWARVVSVKSEARPRVVAEYKLPQNDRRFCQTPAARRYRTFSSHNPTVLGDLAFVTWHAGGLQAIDLARPARPRSAGSFSPRPLVSVATEDPLLGRDPPKVVMWTYPIIRNGLIYVVDIRNGLYVLRYRGPHAREVARIRFLEGNSNLGDAVRLAGGRR